MENYTLRIFHFQVVDFKTCYELSISARIFEETSAFSTFKTVIAHTQDADLYATHPDGDFLLPLFAILFSKYGLYKGAAEMPALIFGTTSMEYTILEQPSKRDITIAVDWKTGVSVVVPEGTAQERIDAALRRKASWILRKLADFQEIKPLSTYHKFISGEKFLYLGRQYRMKVQAQDNMHDVSLVFQNGRFVATVPTSSTPTWRGEQLREAFRAWYITHGLIKVQQRMKLFAPRLGLAPSKVVVKEQQARWGSCTKAGIININWRVLMAPMKIVDYVVVHELSHMIHADHSAEFWTVVSSVMPDYDERKEWLRIYGATLQL